MIGVIYILVGSKYLIPTLNEGQNIAEVLTKVINCKEISDIVLIDGGSTDNTIEISKKFNVHILYQKSTGKGGAVIEALEHFSDDDRVIMIDGDSSYNPEDTIKFLEKLEPNVLVNGSRFLGKLEKGSMSLFHYIGNKILNYVFNKAFKQKTTDILSGMKAFIIRDIRSLGLKSGDFEIETEIMAKYQHKFSIIEVPIQYCHRKGNSKLKPIRDGWRILKRIWKERKEFKRTTLKK
jgi:dolichol-phosphate hexosyltransferase